MKLNASKCKEMLMCFLRKRPQIQPLRVNVKVLETVKSHKVLGLIIQDCLKWNKHIEMSTSKASKRLQIIRVLRRGGIPPQDLLHIYYVLIHSVLEYCCVIWHNSQPKYLSKNIEMIYKRALRIILPGTSYSEALAKLNCPRLDARRTFLCQKTIRNDTPGCYLSRHLPQTRESSHKYDLRNKSNLSTFNCRTNRFHIFLSIMIPFSNL